MDAILELQLKDRILCWISKPRIFLSWLDLTTHSSLQDNRCLFTTATTQHDSLDNQLFSWHSLMSSEHDNSALEVILIMRCAI